MSVRVNGLTGVSKVQDTAIQMFLPPGAVSFFAQNTAPTGWLKANGAAVSRTTYASLFTAIGITFGAGDGSTTFNLPDMRGYFPRGWDDGRGVDSGRTFGSTQSHDFASHGHQVKANSFAGDLEIVMGPIGGDGAKYSVSDSGNDANSTGVFRAINTGGTETRPVNISFLGCIKY